MSSDEEVVDQVIHAALGQSARTHPFMTDQFYGLPEQAIRVLDRVKAHVASADSH